MTFDGDVPAGLAAIVSRHGNSVLADRFPGGWPMSVADVKRCLIQRGRADFCQSVTVDGVVYEPETLCRFYVACNQQRHLRENLAVLRAYLEPSDVDDLRRSGLTIVDLGCGPMTAGASMLWLVDDRIGSVTYVGVDRAEAMLGIAHEFAESLRGEERLFGRDDVQFVRELGLATLSTPRADPTFVLCSFLLSSDTLKPGRFADELEGWLSRNTRGPCHLLLLNSTHHLARKHHVSVQAELEGRGFTTAFDAPIKVEDPSLHYTIDTYAMVFTRDG